MILNHRPGQKEQTEYLIMNGKKAEKGYLLIGTMLYIIIIGLTMSAYATVWSTTVRVEKEEQLRFCLKEMRRGIEKYKVKTGTPPDSLKEMYNGKYIRKIYIDPFTSESDWKTVEENGRIIDVKSSTKLKNPAGEEYSKW